MNSPKTSCLRLLERGDGMYESPINLYYEPFVSMMLQEQEKTIVKAVQKFCVGVDEEELKKALAYDRNQYEKGYADGHMDGHMKGYAKAKREIVRCGECKYWQNDWKPENHNGHYCELNDIFKGGDWYCADGKRKENDEEEGTA